MTGPEHYQEAARILKATIEYARDHITTELDDDTARMMLAMQANHLAAAQAHATLALAAATAVVADDEGEWREAISGGAS